MVTQTDGDEDEELVIPSEETTLKDVKAPSVPIDQIRARLESEDIVNDVRIGDASDYVYGLMVEVDVPEGCSFHLRKALRDLGLYIEYGETVNDEQTVYCRRIHQLLERMEQHGEYDDYPDHPF